MYLGTLAAQPGILRPRVRGLCASHAVRDPSHGPSPSVCPHIGDQRRLPPPRPETLRSAGRCPCLHQACCVRSSDRDVSLKSKSDNVVTAQKPRHQTQSPAYACETLSLGPTCVRPHAPALAPCRPSHCAAAGSAGMAASVTAFMSPGHRALLSLHLQSCFPTPLTVPYSLICFLSITDCHMPL